jgi:hypothetical protein
VADTTVKRFLCCGFRRTGKAMGKCSNVGGVYVEKYVFLPGSNITFYVLYPFVTYLLTLPRSNRIRSILICRILTGQGNKATNLKVTKSMRTLIF